MTVPLQQQDVGSEPSGANGGGATRRTTTDHQHVNFGKDRDLAGWLEVRSTRAGAPGVGTTPHGKDAWRIPGLERQVLDARACPVERSGMWVQRLAACIRQSLLEFSPHLVAAL
jgi:hypothetical protein